MKNAKMRSSYVKPFLTPDNMKERLRFAMGFLQPRLNGTYFFGNMYNYVHIDEKWFYLTTVKKKFYVYANEVVATRACKSKRFITKVMFLAAVARPRYDANKKCIFDRKIGIWPFVQKSVAVRTSRNRPKGAILTVTQSVDSDVYYD
ncbi:Aste57867_7242 [Aphanomyces stellatus]|uniref:Aste57867_6113 protein n=1 Tax=Aphanomyces stellatus TaxID=120398 RepID=A0A485KFQ1_9STRA|nr:hypothetical protein As57867_007217 [Aphanomyces stellatus]KAF0709047.1 hypothetical protein As57867_006099 [Aphanomyces stellatus]VFT83120.1 Aste57867_6113 [Aphanomyces stellatus]VFT84166.1 Aste57867_7242 [Aphanomyces stellatus]